MSITNPPKPPSCNQFLTANLNYLRYNNFAIIKLTQFKRITANYALLNSLISVIRGKCFKPQNSYID
jgi:hypothetical protein